MMVLPIIQSGTKSYYFIHYYCRPHGGDCYAIYINKIIGDTMKFEWSRFWFGVSHIKNISKRYQITVNKWDNGSASVYLIDKDKASFSHIKEHQSTVANCKGMGEKWAEQIIGRHDE